MIEWVATVVATVGLWEIIRFLTVTLWNWYKFRGLKEDISQVKNTPLPLVLNSLNEIAGACHPDGDFARPYAKTTMELGKALKKKYSDLGIIFQVGSFTTDPKGVDVLRFGCKEKIPQSIVRDIYNIQEHKGVKIVVKKCEVKNGELTGREL